MRPWPVLLLLAGCQASVTASLETASDLMYEQRYADAERLYRKVLKRLSDTEELDADERAQRLRALDRLGQLNAFYLANFRQAAADYDLIIRFYPQSDAAVAAYTALADLHAYKLGEPEGAIDALQAMVTAFPERPEARRARLRLAATYSQQRNFEQARAEAQQLVAKWPGTSEAHQAEFLVAQAFHMQGRFREAIAAYVALLREPLGAEFSSLVNFEIGNAHQELGESRQALEYFYECLAAHPNPQVVQHKIARVRRRLEISRPTEMFGVLEAPAPAKPPRKAHRS